MGLFIETDIGHDPDDILALRYLYLKGVDIEGVIITPGFEYQYALARKVLPGITVYGSNIRPNNQTSQLSKLYKSVIGGNILDRRQSYDKHSSEINIKNNHLLVIGPPTNAIHYQTQLIRKTIFQGGFIPYSVYKPSVVLDKFLGINACPSFNVNGSVAGTSHIVNNSNECWWVPKNVCHTVTFKSIMFKDGFLTEYTKGWSPDKKIHDLVAAVMYLKPNIGTWICGYMQQVNSGWTFLPQGNTDTLGLVDLDYDAFYGEIESV